MRIDRSLYDEGSDFDGSDVSDLAIVCCVSACGLTAAGLFLLGPPNAGTLCLIAAAAGVSLALWTAAGQPSK